MPGVCTYSAVQICGATSWDDIASHLGGAFFFFVGLSFPVLIVMGTLLNCFEQYKNLIVEGTVFLIGLNFVIGNVLIAKWTVESEQERHQKSQ